MKYSFWVSSGTHFLLLLFFSFITLSQKGIKEEANRYVPASISVSLKQPLFLKESSKTGLLKARNNEKIEKKNLQQERSSSSRSSEQKKSIDKKSVNTILLKILHESIAEKLIYPENALELKQTGTVKVGLLLLPSGEISASRIVKSSGSDVIDDAAITAVRSIPRVKEAALYLSSAQFFSVDVVFQI